MVNVKKVGQGAFKQTEAAKAEVPLMLEQTPLRSIRLADGRRLTSRSGVALAELAHRITSCGFRIQ